MNLLESLQKYNLYFSEAEIAEFEANEKEEIAHLSRITHRRY